MKNGKKKNQTIFVNVFPLVAIHVDSVFRVNVFLDFASHGNASLDFASRANAFLDFVFHANVFQDNVIHVDRKKIGQYLVDWSIFCIHS
ncbi:hypothetical protein [Sporomusa acidovorans]|uniref:hypothetical protein n=1 Tax=Sporomusa acidovorans TaxID=112900 RepID=UPI00146F66C6|nr:hypothetical protein [Sporomusa acidovorans]